MLETQDLPSYFPLTLLVQRVEAKLEAKIR